MKNILKFFAVFTGILLLSAFLAPILYDLFQTFHPYKFERIFNRLVMIGTLVAAVFFVRIRKDTFAQYGLLWRKESPGLFLTGFLTGILVLAISGALRVFFGQAIFRPDTFTQTEWIFKFAGALGTGLLIGLMEEFFFRGFVFRSFLKVFKNRLSLSVLITTALYSIVHFIGMKKIFVDSDPSFWDGLRLMGAPFLSLAEWPQFWPQAAGLFIFGFVLIATVWRTGSLYPAIGLHAGCVFFLRLDDSFLQFQSVGSVFWGSKIIYDGIFGWSFLLLIGLLLIRILKKVESQQAA